MIAERNCSFAGNTAPAGGGGALLVEASVETMLSPPALVCSHENVAMYGPCAASTFKSLEVSISPPAPSRTFAGFVVQLTMVKVDAYGQVISSDSSSLVRVLTSKGSAHEAESTMTGSTVGSLVNGWSSLNLSFYPKFRTVDYAHEKAYLDVPVRAYVEGLDSDQTTLCKVSRQMQSKAVNIVFANGSEVCPRGYVLVVDDFGFGSCSRCSPGTYSLLPLAGTSSDRASCMQCPVGSKCYGGDNVSLSIGAWNESGGRYILFGCPDRHQLVNSVGGVFSHDIQHCLACREFEYILDPNNPLLSCQTWTALIYVDLTVDLAVPMGNFTSSKRLSFVQALAAAASVPIEDIMIVTVYERRQFLHETIHVSSRVAAQNESLAAAVAQGLSLATLNKQLSAFGLPPASNLVATVTNEKVVVGDTAAVAVSSEALKISLSTTLSAIIAYFAFRFLYKYYLFREFVSSIKSSNPGDKATQKHLPYELKKRFKAEEVLDKSSVGCTIKAKVNFKGKEGGKSVSIKVLVPDKSSFNSDEMTQLAAEAKILQLVTDKKCASAAHLAGTHSSCVHINIAWFVLDTADAGESVLSCIRCEADGKQGLLDSKQCIKLACDVLSALRVMHGEKFIHRDVRPAHIVRCKDPHAARGSVAAGGTSQKMPDGAFLYKLADFGCSADLREPAVVLTASPFMSEATVPYMSPEMLATPDQASFPADLWSLGVTMFQLTTGELPLGETASEQEGHEAQARNVGISSDMSAKLPSVLDRMEGGRRAKFDGHLARVIERALEKKVENRYRLASEMDRDIYRCLVMSGEASYSVFISYRVASESPLANLLFDELNQTVTPGGHRVTVYLDEVRLIKGEDWEEGFSTGLLNSLCFFPLLSYGATAPLALLPKQSRSEKILAGWEERPCGRARLEGAQTDAEDNVLKEFLIAGVLSERSKLRGREGVDSELGKLQTIYPIFVGRQEPEGHPRYPGMGSFFDVMGGGGRFTQTPSIPTNAAVVRFLREKASISESALEGVMGMSVEATIKDLTRLQGCQLWRHAPDIHIPQLSNEQEMKLLGKGFVGPAVNLGEVVLTEKQKQLCGQGFDREQLRMLKAQVRAKVSDFHEVIDQAVEAKQNLAMVNRLIPSGLSYTGPGEAILDSGHDGVTDLANNSKHHPFGSMCAQVGLMYYAFDPPP